VFQVFNFVYSLPQLFKIVPCPRHRLPVFDPKVRCSKPGCLSMCGLKMPLTNLDASARADMKMTQFYRTFCCSIWVQEGFVSFSFPWDCQSFRAWANLSARMGGRQAGSVRFLYNSCRIIKSDQAAHVNNTYAGACVPWYGVQCVVLPAQAWTRMSYLLFWTQHCSMSGLEALSMESELSFHS